MSSSYAKFFARLCAVCAALACARALPASAQAGDPDIRNLQPFVMLIVDTSGSMEKVPASICTCPLVGDPACITCLPQCSLDNSTQQHIDLKKNRWAFVLEALTGKFFNFQCSTLARTVPNGMTYDVGYNFPYNQPWACPTSGPCPYAQATVQPLQDTNGVLDTYSSRLRFGLMTFDGMETYFGANPLIVASSFNATLSNAQNGMWSYAGAHPFHYPGCTEDYMMDTGARSSVATEGGLVSVSTTSCPSPPCDMYQINSTIQDTLLRTRPYGGTPIAASLDDLYYHFKNDATDTFGTCRDRYALLITDGEPDDDYRFYGCDCKRRGNCPAHDSQATIDSYKCPYPLAEDVAYDLVNGRAGDQGQMKKLFVIGISIGDAESKGKLNLIASQGGSTDLDADGNTARFADDFGTLQATLDKLFGGLSRPVSRSVPAFAFPQQLQTRFPTNPPAQYQLSTGFQVALDQPVGGIAAPWTGIIERQRFGCTAGQTDPEADPLSSIAADGDKFHEVLNAMPDPNVRDLWTVMPNSVTNALTNQAAATILQSAIDRGASTSVCGVGGCPKLRIDDSKVNNKVLGLAVSDTTTQGTILGWMFGKSGSVRGPSVSPAPFHTPKRLADIYHSSPVVMNPPAYATTDADYSNFRTAYSTRPLTLFVGSNDGVLHAFSVEDYTGAKGNLTAGQEIWGFVPPILLPKLQAQLGAHQFGMDGTPELKDVQFSTNPAAGGTDYHTVLISGMRGGGNAYVALDVSDPQNPVFLWQFSDPDMGFTYGRPAIVSATFNWNGNSTPETRAVAILAGGVGKKDTTPGFGCGTSLQENTLRTTGSKPYTTYADIPPAGGAPLSHRQTVQCWARSGRALFFVDVATGTLIKKIFDTDIDPSNGTVFASPVVGSPAMFPDGVGEIAKEGFVLDADGLLWRIDLSAPDPDPTHAWSGWTVRPFHDIFWDGTYIEGEPTYERPILSTDDQHRLVVILGTGDGDNFDKPTVKNRVVSLTEVLKNTPPSTPDDYAAAMNWEIRVPVVGSGANSHYSFVQSELVTGSMALFQGTLFMASFVSVVNTTNACAYGRGRYWSVDYHQRDAAYPNATGTYGPLFIQDTLSTQNTGLATNAAVDASLFNKDISDAEPNLLVLGLSTTQRPTCKTGSPSVGGYFGYQLPEVVSGGTPAIWLVAQASSNGNRVRAGSQLGRVEVQMQRSAAFTRVTGWVPSID